VVSYKERMDQDHDWAWNQGGRHFRRDSDLFKALRRIAPMLRDLGISYAVIGGMALFEHGYERFTMDIDLLVTAEGLRAIHDCPEALGCARPFADRKQVWDVETGVRIDFLVAGTYPGDAKPITFPDPAEVGVERDGITYVRLETLVELKLASGMTGGTARMMDFADAIALIMTLKLPADFADRLHPFVRERYAEFWVELQGPIREP
jgi:hypothetical protein